MKILIDARVTKDRTAGISTYVVNLVTNLARIDYKNEYNLLVSDDSFEELVKEYSNFKTVYTNIPWLSFQEQIRLPLLLRKLKPDVFHATSFVVPRIRVCPTVITIHDLIHIIFRRDYSLVHRLYYRFIVKPALQHASLITTDSHASQNDLIKHFDLEPSKIKVVWAGVEERYGEINQREIEKFKERYNLPDKFMLYVGNHKSHKNLERLFESFSQFSTDSSWFLVITGREDEYIKGLKIKYGLDKIKCVGFLNQSEMPRLYQSAHIFVMPSLYEGFGLPILEAMAAGTPAITSDLSSTAEIADSAALLVNPYNVGEIKKAMFRLATDNAFRASLQKKGRERVQLFTWEKCARQFLNIYETVTASSCF
jgi:glycosyltransferase involved in cell wall biosynthesis